MGPGDRAAAARGVGSSTSRAAVLTLASLLGCSIGTGTNETFGSAASVGGNTQGNGSGDSGDGSGSDDPDGPGSGGQDDGATSANPPGDTDDPPPPGSEVCNGLDDDGDGMVDEDQPSTTCGVGSCEVTEPSCVGGVPQECTPALPGGEVCNGLDDDCNGAAEDGCNTCAHDICLEGGALVVGCDPCVTSICGVDPFCCNNSWDSFCVSEVGSVCGLVC